MGDTEMLVKYDTNNELFNEYNEKLESKTIDFNAVKDFLGPVVKNKCKCETEIIKQFFLKANIDKNGLIDNVTMIDFFRVYDENIIEWLIKQLLPEKQKIKYLKLDDADEEPKAENISLYSTKVKDINFIIDTNADDTLYYENKDSEDGYEEYPLRSGYSKVLSKIKQDGETLYQISIEDVSRSLSRFPFDGNQIYLKVEINYVQTLNNWEQYLSLSYKEYLNKNYRLAFLLAFISLESLIKNTRHQIKGVMDNAGFERPFTFSEIAPLFEIYNKIGIKRRGLKEKLIDIFEAMKLLGRNINEFDEQLLGKRFQELADKRNEYAHGGQITDDCPDMDESDNDYIYFYSLTLILVVDVIAVIRNKSLYDVFIKS